MYTASGWCNAEESQVQESQKDSSSRAGGEGDPGARLRYSVLF